MKEKLPAPGDTARPVDAEVVPYHTARAGNPEDRLPQIGEWYWVKVEEYEYRKDKRVVTGTHEELACVEHVASNHIRLEKRERRHGETFHVMMPNILAEMRPEANWRRIIEDEMEEVRREIEKQQKLLYDAGVKANALPDPNARWQPDAESSLLPAIRVSDPVKQKRDLVALKNRIPKVAEKISELAERFAGLARNLCLPELARLEHVKAQLEVVEDKIFTIEVYAGLKEEVVQIADGEAAPPDSKIVLRQCLRYMDEETLIDYDKGGMDYGKLKYFDQWIAKPENFKRIIPEPRAVVAFQVRRNMKNYGPVQSIFDAFQHMEWHKQDKFTYLLFKNGDRIFRIASEVDFAPRLIPTRTEFDLKKKFTKERHFSSDEEGVQITPDHIEYDKYTGKLKKELKHYNRIIVLLQGLLDRSEVFSPHPIINLATSDDINDWITLLRDEEDGLPLRQQTFEEYRDAGNAKLRKGDLVLSLYADIKVRPYGTVDRPIILPIVRIRKCTQRDVDNFERSQKAQEYRDRRNRSGYSERWYDRMEFCNVGDLGVDVEWHGGESWRGKHNERWGRWREKAKDHNFTMFIPMRECFNLLAYKSGDYKRFLCDYTMKGEYLKWAPILLRAEDYVLGRKIKGFNKDED